MLKKCLYLLLFIVVACSGERYDISKAINILPDKTNALTPNFALEGIPVNIEQPYYSGTLSREKVAFLNGISSNFEIQKDEIFYVQSNRKFVKINQEKKAIRFDFSKLIKNKRNVNSSLFTLNHETAVVVSSAGDVIAIDIDKMELKWSLKIEDITTVKPFIHNNEVIVPTSSGAIHVFNLNTGDLVMNSSRFEDPTGVQFNLINNLKTVKIEAGNIFATYYKTNLIFFDLLTKSRVYSFSLIEDQLSFDRITADPILYKNLIIVPTSANLSAVSLSNGIKLWQINGDFSGNLFTTGGFAFAFERNSKNIVALSTEDGDVKWKFKKEERHKFDTVWMASSRPNTLIAIDNKGYITKLNISNGTLFKEEKRQKFYSDRFNYKLIDDKIYYTHRGSLIVLN